MRDAWRHFAAEFVGIFGLVFIGGGAIMSAAQQQINPLVPAAIAHGLILAIMVTATMRQTVLERDTVPSLSSVSS